jgi:O-antigen ligase
MIWLDRAALLAGLALPAAMLHGRALAEILLGVLIGLFLLHSALRRDWTWLRTPWLRIGLLWWGWLLACSLPLWPGRTGDSLAQALVAGRYLLAVAALQHYVLRPAPARRWLLMVLDALTAYIAVHLLAQAALGISLYGQPRWDKGQLTGPFDRPRAAAPLSRLLLPVLLRRLPGLPAWAGVALIAAGIGIVALAGQRMPLFMLLFGLVVSGLMLPALRRKLLAAILAGVVLTAAAAALSPPVASRLELFASQLADLPDSDYGRIAAHAAGLVAGHPLTGLGARGFRLACDVASPPPGCAQHPHNHYLEAAVDAGLPGLALFSALVLAWLMALARGRPDALRVGLFAAVLVQEWPLSSMSNFGAIEFALPMVLLALGLAEADASARGGEDLGDVAAGVAPEHVPAVPERVEQQAPGGLG